MQRYVFDSLSTTKLELKFQEWTESEVYSSSTVNKSLSVHRLVTQTKLLAATDMRPQITTGYPQDVLVLHPRTESGAGCKSFSHVTCTSTTPDPVCVSQIPCSSSSTHTINRRWMFHPSSLSLIIIS